MNLNPTLFDCGNINKDENVNRYAVGGGRGIKLLQRKPERERERHRERQRDRERQRETKRDRERQRETERERKR